MRVCSFRLCGLINSNASQDFRAFTLQGWVATAFVLAQTVFLLFYGQVLRIFPAKWVLVSAVIIFETGSLICGVAQNVNQLIVGRTVSGIGAAGMCESSCCRVPPPD